MNQAAFRQFYQTTYRPLWSYLYRMAKDTELCNDLAQESYFRYLKSARPVSSTSTDRSYLFSIATNLLKDYWRSGKVHGEWMDENLADEQDESAEQLPLRLDVEAAMEQLTLMQRSLLWLCYVEGYPHDEVAKILGIQSTSVRVLLMRARKRMAQVCHDIGMRSENRL